ncbi:hypothetical protein IC582_013072 [Cucumis melo]|uniref:Uncharacterized protein n=2 Tax=Cucumis melo TaxID=3656 RepID=A0A5D3DFF5_CUCMM|nr:uncharacterized protein LOC103484039 [Cucumis melo]TYK22273.1 uncharacterized protein E5676_scaffold440G00280 [Cucumis melo var. makuwa]
MGCKLNSPNTPILFKFATKRSKLGGKSINFSPTSCLNNQNQETPTKIPKSNISTVHFKSLTACKLGISRFPDFRYNAEGGTGTGSVKIHDDNSSSSRLLVSFDVGTLYIPPLTTQTTKFLGLPLPPFLKIDILPEFFQGSINQESGKVELEFESKFIFSIGSLYKAPPLLVKTVLSSEESRGIIRSGKGERLDDKGKCRLVGVATVDPIDDLFLNSFLSLPTECIANLNAIITFS